MKSCENCKYWNEKWQSPCFKIGMRESCWEVKK